MAAVKSTDPGRLANGKKPPGRRSIAVKVAAAIAILFLLYLLFGPLGEYLSGWLASHQL